MAILSHGKKESVEGLVRSKCESRLTVFLIFFQQDHLDGSIAALENTAAAAESSTPKPNTPLEDGAPKDLPAPVKEAAPDQKTPAEKKPFEKKADTPKAKTDPPKTKADPPKAKKEAPKAPDPKEVPKKDGK